MALSALKEMDIHELTAAAVAAGLEDAPGSKKHDLIFRMLHAQAQRSGLLFAEGVLEILPDGYGFLRAPDVQLPRRAPTTSTSRRRRSGASTCAPATRSSGQVRPPQRGRALLRAASRSKPSTSTRPRWRSDKVLLRQPDAALPARAAQARDRAADSMTTRIIDLLTPDRQGPARPDRRAAARRQDDAPAEHRERDRREPPRGDPDRAADRRAARGGHRHAAHREGRGDVARPSTSRPRATCRSPRW